MKELEIRSFYGWKGRIHNQHVTWTVQNTSVSQYLIGSAVICNISKDKRKRKQEKPVYVAQGCLNSEMVSTPVSHEINASSSVRGAPGHPDLENWAPWSWGNKVRQV